MTNKFDFNEITENIVRNFLHNVLFIDDSAYRPDEDDDFFDSEKISSVFAKHGILTTIFSPLVESDLSYCKKLFYKSDVIVLDWNLKLDSTSDDLDEEVDSDNDEPRGFYTKRLIKSYVDENIDKNDKTLKLFLIYTVEMDLVGVTKYIYEIAEYINWKYLISKPVRMFTTIYTAFSKIGNVSEYSPIV